MYYISANPNTPHDSTCIHRPISLVKKHNQIHWLAAVVCFLSKQVNPSLQSIKKKEGKIDCILRLVLPTSNFLL